jgi:Argininosuccinate lyase
MKLWQTHSSQHTHPLIADYLVGNDYLLDMELLPYDIQASQAHVQMLHKIKILTKKEEKDLIQGLDEILLLWKKGKFVIDKEQEDGHTAIEEYLTKKLGETGKKIHTGRSRNDQVLVALRLYTLDQLRIIQTLI